MKEATLIVGASPHVHSGASVQRMMIDVIIALTPAIAAAIWFFGWNAVRLIFVCVASCMITEWLCRKLMRRENSLSDFSAMLTGLLIALNLPPGLPNAIAAIGSVFAIAVAKQVFGGLGYNPFNPAAASRAFLLVSFTGPMMTSWTTSPIIDATTSATPLSMAKMALKAGEPFPLNFDGEMAWHFFVGNINGCLGETCSLMLLLGAIYLLARRVIGWHTPVAFIGSAALYAAIYKLIYPEIAAPVLFHLLSGGLILGAFFMATDMVTSPTTNRGRFLFGVGCGVLTMIIRTVPSGGYPEGVSFAILIMNAFVPLINRAAHHKAFGQVHN